MQVEIGYTYDDVLLIPKYSEVESRDNVDLSVQLPKGIKLDIPLISANMSHVTGPVLATEIAKVGGMAILHRFDDVDTLENNYFHAVEQLSQYCSNGAVGVSVGVKEKDLNLLERVIDPEPYKRSLACKVVCVDVAHGHHKLAGEFVNKVSRLYPEVLLIAGNVCTPEGARYLYEAGADVIKIGIGPSGVCTTRIETGNGYPQLSALDNISNTPYVRRGMYDPVFIADGGITNSGNISKALTFADLVMIGGLFAGTDESPGNIISIDGKKYKQYAGSSTHKKKHVEGVSGLVPYRGSLADVVDGLLQGVRSCCSYQGVSNLNNLKIDPRFVSISNSGLKESLPHDIRL